VSLCYALFCGGVSAMLVFDSSLMYFYAVFSVVVVIFYLVFRDRSRFSSTTSGVLVFLSFMLLLSSGLLVVLSFGDGSSSGGGSVGLGGKVSYRPMGDVVREVVLSMIFPFTLFLVTAASYMVFSEMSSRALSFDAACILLAGSLLLLFFITGAYRLIGSIFIVVTLVLFVSTQNYKHILIIIIILYLIGVLF
jgi:hypothetical protein